LDFIDRLRSFLLTTLHDKDSATHGWVAVTKVLVLTRAIEGEAGSGAFSGKAEIDCPIPVFWRA
jgi:hypothetical protein